MDRHGCFFMMSAFSVRNRLSGCNTRRQICQLERETVDMNCIPVLSKVYALALVNFDLDAVKCISIAG